jgi:UDP-N-acetylmuramate--alanine ligase
LNLGESHIHFVGIGGIGMSGIAEVLVNMGCKVTGTDAAVNAQVERLQALGVEVKKGHSAKNLPLKCDALVYSSAVKPSNPEVVEAKKRKVPIIQRAEMLAELMGLKRGIAIGGTHGKTSTTSIVATMLLSAQLEPTIVIGGRLDLIKSTAALGKGEWFVAEADESDGSFLRLSPEIVVVTNIDNDHLDHYRDFKHLEKTFDEFCRKIPFYGVAILCVDDPFVAKLASQFDKRMMTYGLNKKARLRANNLKSVGSQQTFEVSLDGIDLGRVTLNVPGRHNVLNALASVAVGLELKLTFDSIAKGVGQYRGVDRRLQIRGQFNEAVVIDDYGHHPTEVLATLAALRQAYPKNRIVVAFQPHRYSRTKTCWKQFLICFKDADVVGVLDIYAAGEAKIPAINSPKLAKAASKKNKNISYWGSVKASEKKVRSFLKPNDVFLTLGAGDVWKLGAELVRDEGS